MKKIYAVYWFFYPRAKAILGLSNIVTLFRNFLFIAERILQEIESKEIFVEKQLKLWSI